MLISFGGLGEPSTSPHVADLHVRSALSACGALCKQQDTVAEVRAAFAGLAEGPLADLERQGMKTLAEDAMWAFVKADDEESESDFEPSRVAEQIVRTAVLVCWMLLPTERRTVADTRMVMDRFLDRALRDFEEDRKHFGLE